MTRFKNTNAQRVRCVEIAVAMKAAALSVDFVGNWLARHRLRAPEGFVRLVVVVCGAGGESTRWRVS